MTPYDKMKLNKEKAKKMEKRKRFMSKNDSEDTSSENSSSHSVFGRSKKKRKFISKSRKHSNAKSVS